MPLGQSFVPFGSSDEDPSAQGATNPVQEAVQLLSLRRPRVLGVSPVPEALLSGLGSAGLPEEGGNPIMSALLQMIRGGFTAPPTITGAGIPTPRVQILQPTEPRGPLSPAPEPEPEPTAQEPEPAPEPAPRRPVPRGRHRQIEY